MEINEMKKKILEKVKQEKEILSSTNAEGNEQPPVEENISANTEGIENAPAKENTSTNIEANEHPPVEEKTSSISADEKFQFQKEIVQLTDENELLERDLKERQDLIKSLESLMKQKTERLIEAEKKLNSLNSEISSSKDNTEKSKLGISQLEEALQKVEQAKADHDEKIGEEIRSLKAGKNKAQQKNDILNEKLLSVQNNLEKKDIKLSKFTDLLREKEDKLNTELHNEIEDVLSEIKLKFQMEESLSSLKAEVDSKNQRLNEILTSTRNEIDDLKTERDNLKSLLETKGYREKELENESAALKVEVATRDSKIEADNKYYNELVKETEEAKRAALLEIEEAAKKSDLAHNKELGHSSEGRKVLGEDAVLRGELETKITQLESEIKEKDRKISEEKKAFGEISILRDELEEKIAQLESEIKEKAKEFSEGKKVFGEDSVLRDELEKKITQLESEIKEKDEKIEESSEEFEMMLSRVEASFKNNEHEKDDISDQLEVQQKINNALKESIKQLEEGAQDQTTGNNISEEQKRLLSIIEEKDNAIHELRQEFEGNFTALEGELKQSLTEREDLEKELAEGISMVEEVYSMLQDAETGNEEK